MKKLLILCQKYSLGFLFFFITGIFFASLNLIGLFIHGTENHIHYWGADVCLILSIYLYSWTAKPRSSFMLIFNIACVGILSFSLPWFDFPKGSQYVTRSVGAVVAIALLLLIRELKRMKNRAHQT